MHICFSCSICVDKEMRSFIIYTFITFKMERTKNESTIKKIGIKSGQLKYNLSMNIFENLSGYVEMNIVGRFGSQFQIENIALGNQAPLECF